MQTFLRYAEQQGADYAELKSQEQEKNIIVIQNKTVKELSTITTKLHSARVLIKGKEALAYSTASDYKKLIDQAIKLAKMTVKKSPFPVLPPYQKKLMTKRAIDPRTISLEEKKKQLLALDHREKYKQITSLNLTYMDTSRLFNLITSDGRDILWDDCRSTFASNAFAKEGTAFENYYDAVANHYGYEVMEKSETITQHTMDIARQLLKAKHPIGGNYPTLVDHHLGGVFAHEAVGHACEADTIIQSASVLQDQIGKKIGTDEITIMDNGTILCNGWTPVDDEGTPGQPTLLIEHGVLKNYLQSRTTAAILGMQPTGNGRAQGLSCRAIPRMTCTYVAPGDATFDEMVRSVKNGYYLKGTMGGQTSPATGQFLFNAQYGYLIKNGEIASMVKGASLTGNILETLKHVHLIGNDIQYNSGTCGKDGQLVPVSDGAPHFVIDNARVGGHT